jgi:hypothetical protein
MSSTWSIQRTGRISSADLILSGISFRSRSFSFGNEHGLDAAAMRRQQFLLEAADRQHLAAQRDLAGHRHVGAHRDAGQRGDQRRAHADAGARAVLGRRAFRARGCACRASRRSRADASFSARLRTTVIAAWIDSCITSPSEPV